jgi:hypothetical protein
VNAVTNARFALQNTHSSRAVIKLTATAAGFRLRLGGGVALRLHSSRHYKGLTIQHFQLS